MQVDRVKTYEGRMSKKIVHNCEDCLYRSHECFVCQNIRCKLIYEYRLKHKLNEQKKINSWNCWYTPKKSIDECEPPSSP